MPTEAVLIVTVIVSPLSIGGQSVEHSEFTREYPQIGIYQCTEQACPAYFRGLHWHNLLKTLTTLCNALEKVDPRIAEIGTGVYERAA